MVYTITSVSVEDNCDCTLESTIPINKLASSPEIAIKIIREGLSDEEIENSIWPSKYALSRNEDQYVVTVNREEVFIITKIKEIL